MHSLSTGHWLLLLAVLNVAIHLLFYDNLGYHRDELLYFSLGQHPAFGYASVPPLIGWLSATISGLLGYSVFAARLIPALAGGFMVLLVGKMTQELGGKSYARILAAIALICTPFSLRTYFLYQPVFLDITFWTLLFYFTIRYLNTENEKNLLILGAISGLAMLNKYLIGLLILALLFSLVVSKYRTAFQKKEMYWGLAVALLIFLPNLIWQFTQGLPIVNHLQELNQTQLVNVSYVNFLGDQLLIPFAATLLTIPGLIYLLIFPQARKYRVLGMTALLVIIALLLLRGKGYYTIGVFPVLVAAGAVFYEHIIRQKYFRWAIPTLLVILTIPILPIGLPIYEPEGLVSYFERMEKDYGLDLGRRFEDGTIHSLPQDYADMLGWESIASLARQAYHAIPEGQSGIIYGENYGQAGAVSIIGQQWDLPYPVSFNDSFYYWVPDSIPPDVQHLIYINDELGSDVESAFSQIKIIGSVSDPHAREYGTTVYLCSYPKESLNSLWQQALARVNSDE
ncbi:MAG: glycosyltransferase family 39 protein [Bacteroidota bacterium]